MKQPLFTHLKNQRVQIKQSRRQQDVSQYNHFLQQMQTHPEQLSEQLYKVIQIRHSKYKLSFLQTLYSRFEDFFSKNVRDHLNLCFPFEFSTPDIFIKNDCFPDVASDGKINSVLDVHAITHRIFDIFIVLFIILFHTLTVDVNQNSTFIPVLYEIIDFRKNPSYCRMSVYSTIVEHMFQLILNQYHDHDHDHPKQKLSELFKEFRNIYNYFYKLSSTDLMFSFTLSMLHYKYKSLQISSNHDIITPNELKWLQNEQHKLRIARAKPYKKSLSKYKQQNITCKVMNYVSNVVSNAMFGMVNKTKSFFADPWPKPKPKPKRKTNATPKNSTPMLSKRRKTST